MRSFLPLLAAVCICVSGQAADDANTETKQAPKRLDVGESMKVEVQSRELFNDSGLNVEAGEHYCFVVADDDDWKDLTIVCDANGWLSKDGAPAFRNAIEKAEKNRRVPAANWFELVGTVGRDEQHHFQIGLRGGDWTYAPTTNGRLFLFANDLLQMYGNNSGSLEVTITRLEAPGKHQLPVNP